jgi:hypothetical protein
MNYEIPTDKFQQSLRLGFIMKKNDKYYLTGFENVEVVEKHNN